MKRRKILTGAGALAGAALTGCGGGDGNSETGNVLSGTTAEGEVQAKIAADAAPATANPATLVPLGTRMARVEVAFTTIRKVTVTLYNTYTGIGTKVGEKAATSSATHALHFGTAFFTNSRWTAANLYLEVTSDTGEIGKEYKAYTDPWAEHEWSYFYRVNATAAWERIATIRFFPSAAEIENFDFSQHLKTYTNTAVVQNLGNLEMTRSEVMKGVLDFPDRSARIISSPENHDTLCLPDLRRAGSDSPFELLPLMTATSGTLRKCVEERLVRQNISRSASIGALRRRRLSDGTKDEFDYDQHYLIDAYHELLAYVGGKQLMDFMVESRAKLLGQFAELSQSFTRPIYNFIKNSVSELISPAELEKTKRTLLEAAEKLPLDKLPAAGGLSGSFNLQFSGGSQNFKWPQQLTGFGLRFSIGLARFSVGKTSGEPRVTTGWLLGSAGTSKGAIVGILKGRSAYGVVDYDIEVTCNLNFQGAKCQLANFQFDPVFDVDTRGYVFILVQNIYKYTLGAPAPDLSVLDEVELSPVYLDDDIESVRSAVEQAEAQDDLGMIEGMAANSNATQTDIIRRYQTFEASPLRLVFHNTRVAEAVFSTAWPILAVAYVPGFKMILGAGYESKKIIESKEVIDFRRVAFVRMTLTLDVHGVWARDPVARALSGYPDNS